MPRPRCCRRIDAEPPAQVFKPAGIPTRQLAQVTLTLDEFEALRLADLEGLYQDQAAARMGISRPTFGRLVEAARRKVADTLVHGKALHIAGGPVHSAEQSCPRCAGRRTEAPGSSPGAG